jgi:hypothetical protein
MKYSIFNGQLVTACSDLKVFKKSGYHCPTCGDDVVLASGEVNVTHFRHKTTKKCEEYGKTDWHKAWQNHFPNNAEITIVRDGVTRRADLCFGQGDNRYFVEFQYSYMSRDEIQARERFYRNLVWVAYGKGKADGVTQKRVKDVPASCLKMATDAIDKIIYPNRYEVRDSSGDVKEYGKYDDKCKFNYVIYKNLFIIDKLPANFKHSTKPLYLDLGHKCLYLMLDDMKHAIGVPKELFIGYIGNPQTSHLVLKPFGNHGGGCQTPVNTPYSNISPVFSRMGAMSKYEQDIVNQYLKLKNNGKTDDEIIEILMSFERVEVEKDVSCPRTKKFMKIFKKLYEKTGDRFYLGLGVTYYDENGYLELSHRCKFDTEASYTDRVKHEYLMKNTSSMFTTNKYLIGFIKRKDLYALEYTLKDAA